MENFKRITSSLLGLPMVIVVLLFGNKYVIDVEAYSVIRYFKIPAMIHAGRIRISLLL